MKCYKCGAEVEKDSKFCSKCGSPQGFSKELIENAKQGNQEAITELYNRTYNNVYQSVRMLVKDEDTALDVVQDAYIRGFQHLEQLDDPNHFRAWMKRIGINTAKNYLKKKQPLLFSEMEGAEEDDSPELQFVDERQEHLPEVSMDRQETTRLINEILDDLSEEQRLVVTLYFYEEMNAREIADELGISEDTVRSRLRYAKKKIETKVLEIEKRDGIRLHSLAPIPFLLLLFRSQKVYAAELPSKAVLQGIQKATAKTLTSAGKAGAETVRKTAAKAETETIKTAPKTVAETAIKAVAETTAKAAAGTATKAIAGKVAVSIAAVAITVGGATYAVHEQIDSNKNNAVETEAETTVDEVEEDTEQTVPESSDAETEEKKAVDEKLLNEVLSAYAEAIQNKEAEDGSEYKSFEFAYIDNDEIPELLAGGGSHYLDSNVYYYSSDGTAKYVSIEFGDLIYGERTGYMDGHFARMDNEHHNIYQLKDGEAVFLGAGMASVGRAREEGRYEGIDYSSEEFKSQADYTWNDEEVTREIYEKNLAEAFPVEESERTGVSIYGKYASLEEACKEQLGMSFQEQEADPFIGTYSNVMEYGSGHGSLDIQAENEGEYLVNMYMFDKKIDGTAVLDGNALVMTANTGEQFLIEMIENNGITAGVNVKIMDKLPGEEITYNMGGQEYTIGKDTIVAFTKN